MPNDVNCKHYDPINGWCEKLSNFGYPKRIEYCPKSPCEHAEPIGQVMTDNDIIKALKCCLGERESCRECPAYNYGSKECVDEMLLQALDLINRQKSEIERLQKYNTDMARKHYNDGIKEFAEKLKADMFYKCGDINYTETSEARKLIDNLVKEMTGEQE